MICFIEQVYHISESVSMVNICESRVSASARGHSSPCLKPEGFLPRLLKKSQPSCLAFNKGDPVCYNGAIFSLYHWLDEQGRGSSALIRRHREWQISWASSLATTV